MIDEEAVLNYCRAARLETGEVLDALKKLADKKEIEEMRGLGNREIAELDISKGVFCEGDG